MKSLKARVLSGVGAALLALSLSAPAMATYEAPDSHDVDVVNVPILSGLVNVLVGKVTALVGVTVSEVKIMDVADVLNNSEIGVLNNVLNNVLVNLQVINLQNVLKDVDVANGLKVGDVLSDNNVDIHDVVDVKIFDVDGVKKILVFHK
ncbi:uncharacterized protein SOCE26_020270 [Sorangium cellulosum]|uniref:Secreted protein n=2 Tax=Sorangium cellulosum TaxID=56 RepID=A0A2L0EMV6_SORCE|nr:uncharacterized protein SOCE26_020270 [Sorangium cellulosum]